MRCVSVAIAVVISSAILSGCSILPKAAMRVRVIHFNTQKAEEVSAYYPEASLPYGGPDAEKKVSLSAAEVQPASGVIETFLSGLFGLIGRIEILTYEKGAELPDSK